MKGMHSSRGLGTTPAAESVGCAHDFVLVVPCVEDEPGWHVVVGSDQSELRTWAPSTALEAPVLGTWPRGRAKRQNRRSDCSLPYEVASTVPSIASSQSAGAET